MDLPNDADRLLAMAMDLEETGKDFYEALALGSDNRRVSALCQRLAKAEEGHYRVFQDMRRKLAGSDRPTPISDKQALHAHELVQAFVMPEPREVHRVAVGGNVKQALTLAVQLEKDSIEFYQQLLPAVPELVAAAARAIIQQEQSHLRDLQAFAA